MHNYNKKVAPPSRTNIYIVGMSQMILGLSVTLFHGCILFLMTSYDTMKDGFQYVPMINPGEVKYLLYHKSCCILSTTMVSFAALLLLAVRKKLSDWMWVWLVANGGLCLLYMAMFLYGLSVTEVWFVLENLAIISYRLRRQRVSKPEEIQIVYIEIVIISLYS